MNKNQFNISQIENGWVVAYVKVSALNNQPEQVMNFCEDYAAVCEYLKSIWPVIVVSNN